jgi:hypothetical protein
MSLLSSKLGKSIFKTVKTRALMAITLCRFLSNTFNNEKMSIDVVIAVLGTMIPSNEVYDEINNVDGAIELLKSLLCWKASDLKLFISEFTVSDSIIYGEEEKKICAGISALVRLNSQSTLDGLITGITNQSTPRLYMVILALEATPGFSFASALKEEIVEVCTAKLRAATAFDIADLVCRLLAISVKEGTKYQVLEELASDKSLYINYNLWLYVSVKLINILYTNKSISPSMDLVDKHFEYLNLSITVETNYDAIAIQIFNKSKYTLICHLISLRGNNKYYLDYCVEQLGICSFDNLEFVYDSLILVISKLKFTVSDSELLSTAIKLSMARFEEAWKSSQSWYRVIFKCIDFLYSTLMLKHKTTEVIKATNILLKWSETRIGIMNPVSRRLSLYWSTLQYQTEIIPWIPTMIDLCFYGPDRQSLDIEVRMETLILHKLSNIEDTDERYETCLWDFNCQDYVVRVDVNLYFMGLTASSFTWELIQAVLERLESKLLKRKNYVNSFNQKLTMRLGMALQVLIGACPGDKKALLLDGLFKALSYEKVVESMAWIEWAISRLVMENLKDLQSRFFAFFKECNKVSHCAHSMVLICLQLIPLIQDPVLKSEFTLEAILMSLSWSGNKLYTIRVLTQYLIVTHHFNHPRLENLSYFIDHISQNQDSQKAFEKIKQYHFFNDFNPTNVTAEFIFNGFLKMMEYAVEERISSLAFVKVFQETGIDYSFDLGYGTRKEMLKMLKRSIRPRIEDPADVVSERITSLVAANLNSECDNVVPHQRKIISWQTFMSTDLELSGFRKLDTPKPRLQLQIIASLISKPVNLGGLTRTCETFSCGLLCMDNLDVIKDPSFLSTCVSAGIYCTNFRKMVPI